MKFNNATKIEHFRTQVYFKSIIWRYSHTANLMLAVADRVKHKQVPPTIMVLACFLHWLQQYELPDWTTTNGNGARHIVLNEMSIGESRQQHIGLQTIIFIQFGRQ